MVGGFLFSRIERVDWVDGFDVLRRRLILLNQSLLVGVGGIGEIGLELAAVADGQAAAGFDVRFADQLVGHGAWGDVGGELVVLH